VCGAAGTEPFAPSGTPFASLMNVRFNDVRPVVTTLTLGMLGVVIPRPAWAHVGRAPEPHDLWTSWTFAPAVIAGLALGACLYARGVRALWRRSAPGRGVARWRVACFAGGSLAIALALLSPIDALGSALFAAHMTQHMLLVVVAAPLLLLGDIETAVLWSLPLSARRGLGRWWRHARLRALWRVLRLPLVAWTLHIGALWLWHLPSFYDAALRSEALHVVEHASFFLTALLFWYPIVEPRRSRRVAVGVATLYLFAAGLQCTLLGAFITFARHPWYAAHYGTTAAWGLSPLEDQQLAGMIMWIPAGFVYLVALLPLVLPLLRAPSQWVTSPTVAGVSARGTP
jgi:putative membrane protein